MEQVANILQEMMNIITTVANSQVVVGETLEIGPAKIVPLSRVSIGFGGGGEGEGDPSRDSAKKEKIRCPAGKGIGSGGGGGAKLRPVGVVVFTDDGVQVKKIPDRKGALDKIFDKIPDLVDLAKKCKP